MNNLPQHILKRSYVVAAILAAGALLVFAQIGRLQIFHADKWYAIQNEHRIKNKTVLADRGSILADDGSVMATTVPYFRVAIDATVIKARDFANFADSLKKLSAGLAAKFGEKLGTDARYYERLVQRAQAEEDRHVYLFPFNRLLDFNEMKYVRSLPILNRGRFHGGLIIEKVNSKRFNPLGQLARITLGRLDEETGQGLRGIEFSLNSALRGEDGEMLVKRVANNLEVPLNYIYEKSAKDGKDVKTTLNVNMQDVVYSALRDGVKRHQAKNGVAILMEVETGKIKAMANYPETYNHAVATQLEPGSTFKIASAMAALEDGLARPSDTVDAGDGGVQYFDHTMRDVHAYGKITFREAIEKSSNIAIADVIEEHYAKNPKKFIARLEDMGVLDYTGFQIRGEPQPLIIKPGNPLWNQTTLPWLSTGYNVKLTPLQLLTFYNAIANNARMVRPYIVSEIRNNSGVRTRYGTEVIRTAICSPKTLGAAQNFLSGVVQSGTARNIRNANYKIAGKTGTAKIVEDGAYQNKYRSSFVGYFPADAPKYSLIVLINEPTEGGYYGATVAAPVFKEIADKIYSTLLEDEYRAPQEIAQISSDLPVSAVANVKDAETVYNRLNISTPYKPETKYAKLAQKEGVVLMKSFKVSWHKVPSVKGMSAKDAMALLENLGLRVALRGSGKVKRQSLEPGERLQKGSFITLTLG